MKNIEGKVEGEKKEKIKSRAVKNKNKFKLYDKFLSYSFHSIHVLYKEKSI